MKFLFCFALAIVVGCSAEKRPTENVVDTFNDTQENAATQTDEAAKDEATDEIVIDVRSQDEWDSGHVKRAVHIPHTEIKERISAVTDDKDAKIVVYCAVGGRAGKAKSALEELGFTNVENAGGYDDIKDRYETPQ